MRLSKFILSATLCCLAFQQTPTYGLSLWPFDWEEVELAATATPRDYFTAPTPEQANAIKFIVTTLADTPTPKLLWYKAELETAGQLIDRVHPLRFLMVVFTDEQQKVAIKNMKKKGGMAWKNFSHGLYGSLQTENEQNNMQESFVVDFAHIVGISPAVIFPHIHNQQWDDFVETLITQIPRKGDYRRYDF